MNAGATSYPQARRVLQANIEGGKRKRILAVIAAFDDEGVQPSLRQIAKRSKVVGSLKDRKDLMVLIRLIRRLEADGLLEVHWATREEKREKKTNVYRVLVE